MTFISYNDNFLKWQLGWLLWGYPHLVDLLLSEYADVRRRNIEKRRTRQNDREAAPAESENEVPPPLPSDPAAELWAHEKARDVNTEYIAQGPDWYALFNPGLERSLDVGLIHTLTHRRCISFISSTGWENDILFLHIIQYCLLRTLLLGR